MSTVGVDSDPRIEWETCEDEARWIERAVAAIADALRATCDTAGHAHLLLSGGSTPAPVYRALAAAPLAWSRITVGLVDERDVEPSHEGSNAGLVRHTLLAAFAGAPAAAPRFRVLREAGASLAASLAAANDTSAFEPAASVVVLGMGEDGHIASLFPRARNLDAAFASTQRYALVDATGSAAAGRFPLRISLTPHAIAAAAARILLLRGASKRGVFERALAAGSTHEAPVRVAIQSPGRALRVIWCRT